MSEGKAKLLTFLIILSILTIVVLSIILFRNRKKIIEKYKVGYVSSFFFAAYMLCPVFLAIFSLISSQSEDTIPPVVIIIYPIIALSVFMYIYRKEPLNYKLGKLFAMLGIGICSAFIFVFKMLTFFHEFESRKPTFSADTITGKSIFSDTGKDIGYLGVNGEIYNETGKSVGYISSNGELHNETGRVIGHINEFGEIYGEFHNYMGHIDENGYIYNETGTFVYRLGN